MSNTATGTPQSTKYFIQRTKWQPKRVTITHTGPFETREDAVAKLKRLRYNKHIDTLIIEKEDGTQ